MSKSKHPIDWYRENTPQNEDEYEAGCLFAFGLVLLIFLILCIGVGVITEH